MSEIWRKSGVSLLEVDQKRQKEARGAHLGHQEQVIVVGGAGGALALRRAGDVDGLRAHPERGRSALVNLPIKSVVTRFIIRPYFFDRQCSYKLVEYMCILYSLLSLFFSL